VIKHWLSYLLVALIACQSVLAMADSHEARTTFPAIEFDQADIVQSELQVNEIDTKNSAQLINIDNCDHCGFCHHGQPVPSLLSFSFSPNTALLKTQYNNVAPSGHLFFLYRPPKA
tara:strand:+ start:13281 stop:13628 length:348 start_codon:yes stop_codon:yes gene_type:complete